MDAVIARLRKDIETLRVTTDSVSYHAKDKDQLADDIEAVLDLSPAFLLKDAHAFIRLFATTVRDPGEYREAKEWIKRYENFNQ